MAKQSRTLSRDRRWDRFIGVLSFAGFILGFCGLASAAPILVCADQPHGPGGTAYVLDVKNNTAYIPRRDGKREGVLITSSDYYLIRFEGNSRFYPKEIMINRYTGNFVLEYGSEPFGNYSSSNVYRTGVCQILKKQKL